MYTPYDLLPPPQPGEPERTPRPRQRGINWKALVEAVVLVATVFSPLVLLAIYDQTGNKACLIAIGIIGAIGLLVVLAILVWTVYDNIKD